MKYDPNKVKYRENLVTGIMQKGVIIAIEDGKVNKFVNEDSKHKWDKSWNNPAIKLHTEIIYNNEKYTDTTMF